MTTNSHAIKSFKVMAID